VKDGNLVAIITDPESALIGKARLKTYPVEERKGIVFVFVGDRDPPPPLFQDLQPGFLDHDLAIVPRGYDPHSVCRVLKDALRAAGAPLEEVRAC
jgi:carbazole 1,9a-dioxygenase terminal dioxygenase component